MIYVLLAVVVTVFLFIALGYNRNISPMQYRRNPKQYLALFGLFIVTLGMYVTVEANAVGIVFDPLRGGLQEASFDEGLHFKAPWVSVTKISTRLRESSFKMTAQTGQIFDADNKPTGGGQFVTYDVTLQYKITVTDAYKFYKNFGTNIIPDSTLQARIREALQDNSTNYDVFSILKGAISDVRLDTETQLRTSLLTLGVYVEAFIINDVDAGVNIEQVVENEATAAKQKEIAIKEQEAALIREETERLKAEIKAEQLIIEANAEAEAEALLKSVTVNAINIMYTGQFETIEIQSAFELNGTGGYLTIQEISDIVITQLYYDSWNGVLPQVVSGVDGISIILPRD